MTTRAFALLSIANQPTIQRQIIKFLRDDGNKRVQVSFLGASREKSNGWRIPK